MDCLDKKTWVEFDDNFKSCTKSKIAKKIKMNDRYGVGRTVNIEAVGTFYNGGGYGHSGTYPFKFVIKCLKEAEIVADSDLAPHALTKNQKEKLCQN